MVSTSHFPCDLSHLGLQRESDLCLSPVALFCLVSPDEGECGDKKEGSGEGEDERKPRRKAYVHKPFLYSRYYSDSDDEVTVEERRRSAVSS